MASKIMTEQHKLMAYLLVTEFNRTQQKIADLFDVSQSTIANAIKEARLLVQIKEMQKELNNARQALIDSGISTPPNPLIDI